MIKEIGKVVDIKGEWLLVETAITSTCNTCAAKSNCGTSTVAKAFSKKSVVNKVKNTLDVKIGESVEIGIPEASMLQGSFYLYLLPLLIALFSAVAAEFWLSRIIEITEGHVILATFFGGYIGFSFSKLMIEKSNLDKHQPILIRIYDHQVVQTITNLD